MYRPYPPRWITKKTIHSGWKLPAPLQAVPRTQHRQPVSLFLHGHGERRKEEFHSSTKGRKNGSRGKPAQPSDPFQQEQQLSEAYALKKGKQMRAELDRGALFSCQADVVKWVCNTGPNLITIPDKWLLDLDTERDDRSDELLLSPNATFLSQQSGM